MKLLVFASGRGSNFNTLVDASKKGEIKAEICGLLCDKNCPAEDIAKNNSIPISILRPKEYPSKEKYIEELLKAVKNYSPDYILLAGYMRILPKEFIDEYPLRIINIHPSMLPAFQGKDAIHQAWNAGVKLTGVTVHYVNDHLDQGVVISQKEVKVPDSLEKLEADIHKTEHKLYVDTIKALVESPFDTLVVSKCLLGENCRYNGGNKHSLRASKLASSFKGRVIPVCPELECGFGVPRPTADIINGRFLTKDGKDLTDIIKKFATEFVTEKLSSSKKVLAVVKEKSPACGKTKPLGLFTSTMMGKLNGSVLVVTEEEL